MATIYVDESSGSDTTGTGATGSPYATISHAIDQAAISDTIKLRGEAYSETVNVDKDGLTVEADTGHSPYVDGLWDGTYPVPVSGVYPGGDHYDGSLTGVYSPLVKQTASDCTWRNIDIRRSSGRGFSSHKTGVTLNNNRLEGCEIRDCYNMATHVHGFTNFVNTGNTIYDNGLMGDDPNNPSPINDIPVTMQHRDGDGLEIANNTSYNNRGEGMGVQQGVRNFTVTDNIVYDGNRALLYLMWCQHGYVARNVFVNTDAGETQFSKRVDGIYLANEENFQSAYSGYMLTDIIIENNIIAGCNRCFYFAYNGTSNIGGMIDCIVANNTFVNSRHDPSTTNGAVLLIKNTSDSSGNLFLNNIIHQDNASLGDLEDVPASISGWTFDYNYWSSTPGSEVTGSNDVVGSGTFSNINNALTVYADFDDGDYAPTSGSNVIDAAGTYSPTNDFYNLARDANDDIGAIEFGTTSETVTASFTASPTSGISPLSVTLTDTSTSSGTIDTWLWEINNGGGWTTLATSQNTSTSLSEGSWDIRLTATTSGGVSDSEEKLGHIVVSPAGEAGEGSGEIGVICDVSPTSGGSQVYTFATPMQNAPKAFLFLAVNSADDAVMGFGAATLTTQQWSVSCATKDNVSTSDAYRHGDNTYCLVVLDGDGNVVARASLTTATETTVTMFWNIVSVIDQYDFTIIAIDALNATSLIFDPEDAVDTAKTLTLGYEFDVLFAGASGKRINGGSASALGLFSMGIATYDGSVSQYCIGYRSKDGQSTTDSAQRLSDGHFVGQMGTGAGATNWGWALEAGNVTSTGLDITTREGSAAFDDVGILALKFTAGVEFGVSLIDSPGSTGNDTIGSLGHDPDAAIIIPTWLTAADTGLATDNAGSVGMGVANKSKEAFVGMSSDDGDSTSSAETNASNNILALKRRTSDSPSDGLVATVDSFGTGEIVLNYTAVNS